MIQIWSERKFSDEKKLLDDIGQLTILKQPKPIKKEYIWGMHEQAPFGHIQINLYIFFFRLNLEYLILSLHQSDS